MNPDVRNVRGVFIVLTDAFGIRSKVKSINLSNM